MSVMYESVDTKGFERSVMIATPSYDRPHAAYTFALAQSLECLHKAGVGTHYILITGNPHIDDCRNEFAHRFLQSECDDMIFIDADVSWDAPQLVELLSYPCDIVGGVYPYRRKDKQDSMPVRLLGGKSPKEGLLEVEGLPTGFMRISRKVVETLAETADTFPSRDGVPTAILFERTLEGDTRFGGDITFCRKWRAAGGEVFAVLDMTLTHAGVFTSSLGEYVRAFERSTLKHVCDKIRAGTETEGDISEALRYIDNGWGADHGSLSTAIILARQANGHIIEAGSGLTTVLMAAANPDHFVYCLEHHGVHVAKIKQMAAEAGVTNIGLCVCDIKDGWYDLSDMELPAHFAVGLVDGPPRSIGNRERFFDHFSPDIVLCDDTDDPHYAEALTSKVDAPLHKISSRASIIRNPSLSTVA